jgi:allantoin racemase
MAGLDEAITSEIELPVIDGVGAADSVAEAIVDLGLKTGKVSTCAAPEPKFIPVSSSLFHSACSHGGAVRTPEKRTLGGGGQP